MRIKFTIGAVLTLIGTLWAQAPEQSETVFRTETRLVVLHASAEDKDGHLVKDLPESAFQVFENGVQQTIRLFKREDVPVSLGLVIDNSNSMDANRPDVNSAALAFAHSSNPQDQMFVVNFSDSVGFGLPEGMPFTNQPAELDKALEKGVVAGGE